MNILVTLSKIGIGNFYNYTQSTNNVNSAGGYALIFLLIIGISIYIALYIPIKLYQINRNTKLIKEELESINKNICNLKNQPEKKELQFKDYNIEVVENIDINK